MLKRIANKVLDKVFNSLATANRKILNKANRKKLINRDFTIISNNCNGSLILHDLGLRFLTPTVNLFIEPEDFLKFVENLRFYAAVELEIIPAEARIYPHEGHDYPIGRLHDVHIHFMHYKDGEEAKKKWAERVARINFDNLFIMMTDTRGFSEEIKQRFEGLGYENKVLFVNRNQENYKSLFYIRGFEQERCLGNISEFKSILGKKYYDDFNYVDWFNLGAKN